MSIEIRPVNSRRELKEFIFLPSRIYQGVPQWVPPLYGIEWDFYNPKKNPALGYSPAKCWLAWRDGKVVGRVMGINQIRMNERWGMKNIRFCHLESPDDPEVCRALLAAVEDWGRSQGMETITGPHGFSDQEPEGMVIKGFEHRATLSSYYNFPYLPKLVEASGYVKDFDYRIFQVPIPREAPALYQKVAQRLRRQGFVLVEFTKTKDIRPHIPNYVKIQNETFRDIYGFVELAPDEGKKLTEDYLTLLDPHFVKFIYRLKPEEVDQRPVDPKSDEIVAFMVGMPDITEGIQAAKGRLLPFGIFKIFSARKKTHQLDLLLAGIKHELRNRGLSAIFSTAFIRDANKLDLTVIDTHQELEFNTKVHAEMLRFDANEYKRSRVFKKELVPGGLSRYPDPAKVTQGEGTGVDAGLGELPENEDVSKIDTLIELQHRNEQEHPEGTGQ